MTFFFFFHSERYILDSVQSHKLNTHLNRCNLDLESTYVSFVYRVFLISMCFHIGAVSSGSRISWSNFVQYVYLVASLPQ